MISASGCVLAQSNEWTVAFGVSSVPFAADAAMSLMAWSIMGSTALAQHGSLPMTRWMKLICTSLSGSDVSSLAHWTLLPHNGVSCLDGEWHRFSGMTCWNSFSACLVDDLAQPRSSVGSEWVGLPSLSALQIVLIDLDICPAIDTVGMVQVGRKCAVLVSWTPLVSGTQKRQTLQEFIAGPMQHPSFPPFPPRASPPSIRN